MSKNVIIYHSLTNSVTNLVKSLPAGMAESHRLESLKPFPKSFLGSVFAVTFTPNGYTKSKALPIDLTSYDKIILAAPLWNGRASIVLRRFIMDNKAVLANKAVAVAIVNGGSPWKTCEADLTKLLPQQKFFSTSKFNAKKESGLASFKAFVEEFLK